MSVNFEVSRLDNNMRCTTAVMPHMESVAIGVWFLVGSRNEEKQIGGISHFIEHMLFKGTSKLDALEISKAIEGIGGSLNAFTSEEYTCYTAVVRKKHVENAFEILSGMVLDSKLDTDELNQERNVILEELYMHMDSPSSYVFDLIGDVMWPDQPLGRSIVGTKESLDYINRDRLKDYMRRFYIAGNMLVSVAGNIDHKTVCDLTAKYFPVPAAQKTPQPETSVEKQTSPELRLVGRKTEQVHFCMGLRTFARPAPERFTQKLMSVILGGNMSSRLFQEIREKRGLAYDISTSNNAFFDTGAMFISAGVNPDKLVDTIKVALAECARMAGDGVSEDELDRAKEYVCGGLVMGSEKTFRNMIWAAENLIYHGRISTKEEIIDQIMAVNRNDILNVARTVFDNAKLSAAVLGPVESKKEEIQNALRFCR